MPDDHHFVLLLWLFLKKNFAIHNLYTFYFSSGSKYFIPREKYALHTSPLILSPCFCEEKKNKTSLAFRSFHCGEFDDDVTLKMHVPHAFFGLCLQPWETADTYDK